MDVLFNLHANVERGQWWSYRLKQADLFWYLTWAEWVINVRLWATVWWWSDTWISAACSSNLTFLFCEGMVPVTTTNGVAFITFGARAFSLLSPGSFSTDYNHVVASVNLWRCSALSSVLGQKVEMNSFAVALSWNRRRQGSLRNSDGAESCVANTSQSKRII